MLFRSCAADGRSGAFLKRAVSILPLDMTPLGRPFKNCALPWHAGLLTIRMRFCMLSMLAMVKIEPPCDLLDWESKTGTLGRVGAYGEAAERGTDQPPGSARKSVWEGKTVSVRVDHGGGRSIKKKTKSK